MEKNLVMLNRQIDIGEAYEAYKVAFKKMFSGEAPWFKNEDDAEDWAGDIAFELVMNALEALGFEIII